MNSKPIATLLALLFGTVLMITGGSLSYGQSQLPSQSFAVSKYGTLLEIFDANGKSRFGKLTNNGFQVSYRSKGKTKSISAVGEKTAAGLVEGEVKVDGQSATVTATTSDHALEITTYFILDEKTKKLIIQRKFRNISAGSLSLNKVREFVDVALVITGETGSTQSEVLIGQKQRLSAAKLTTLAMHKIGVGFPLDCRAGECPKPDPPCPPPYCISTEAIGRARLIKSVNPLTGELDKFILEAQNSVTLQSQPLSSETKQQKNQTSFLVHIEPPPM